MSMSAGTSSTSSSSTARALICLMGETMRATSHMPRSPTQPF
jgi:hypothetical protein